MPLPRRWTVTAALAAVAVLGAPAALAHAPRDHRPGSPLMDLEVLVTPAVTGRTTPGGADAVVSVDSFGNRFALARKEDAETLVGVDQRARAAARAGAWQWWSVDEGASWENLETLPRGAEVALPQGLGRDVASTGTRTYLAEVGPAGAVVTAVTATKRARVTAATPVVVPFTTVPGRTALAAGPSSVVLVVPAATGGSQVLGSRDGSAWSTTPTPVTGTDCDVAVDRRSASKTVTVACLQAGKVLLHTSNNGGATFATRTLGSADTRGGDGGTPSVDMATDGTPFVSSGLQLWRVSPRAVTTQDARSEGGANRATAMAISHKGRVGMASYRKGPDGTWTILVTVFTPGKSPVWSNFANHDPVSPPGAAAPPSPSIAVDFDAQGRIQVLWTSTLLHQKDLDRPLLRNVWSIRSTTS